MDELINLIAGSAAEDWHQIQSGTTYTDRFAVSGAGDGDTVVDVDQHPYLATYRRDVDVRVAWGAARDSVGFFGGPAPSLSFDWNTFPDRDVSARLLDVFYRGALVYRATYLDVDGGRDRLPFPHTREHDGQLRQLVGQRQVDLVGLLEELTKSTRSSYQANLAQAGFTTVEWHLDDSEY